MPVLTVSSILKRNQSQALLLLLSRIERQFLPIQKYRQFYGSMTILIVTAIAVTIRIVIDPVSQLIFIVYISTQTYERPKHVSNL